MSKADEVRAALARGDDVVIGRVLANTFVTPEMVRQMMEATLRGEAIHTYFDGETVKTESVDLRVPVGTSAQIGRQNRTTEADNDRQSAVDETGKSAHD